MSAAASEEILEIDLEEIKNSQPATVMSEKKLREEVDELRARIRQDFPDDSEFGFADEEEAPHDDQHVQEPDEVYKEVSVEPQLNEGVELESVCEDTTAQQGSVTETVETIDVTLGGARPGSPGSLLDVSEVDQEDWKPELGVDVTSTESEAKVMGEDKEGGQESLEKDIEAEVEGEHEIEREGDIEGDEDVENVELTEENAPQDLDDSDSDASYNITDPNTIKSCFSVPVRVFSPAASPDGSAGMLLYGKEGIVSQAPNRDVSLEQIFEILRNYYTDLPSENELYLCMPQLGLRLGEDNIYCRDTTLVDLVRLLDTCDEHPEFLRVELEHHDRFISKLNALFDVLNDQPPAKRHRAASSGEDI